MENDTDQTGLAVGKVDPPGSPACLKSGGLIGNQGAVRRLHRGKQGAEQVCSLPAEDGGILFQGFQIQKQKFIPLNGRLTAVGGDGIPQQGQGGDAAVIPGEAAVFRCPCILHGVRIVFGLGGGGSLKAIGEPFPADAVVEQIHPLQQTVDPGLGDACIPEGSGEQRPGSIIGQIGIGYGFQGRLGSIRLPAASGQSQSAQHQCQKQGWDPFFHEIFSPICIKSAILAILSYPNRDTTCKDSTGSRDRWWKKGKLFVTKL